MNTKQNKEQIIRRRLRLEKIAVVLAEGGLFVTIMSGTPPYIVAMVSYRDIPAGEVSMLLNHCGQGNGIQVTEYTMPALHRKMVKVEVL